MSSENVVVSVGWSGALHRTTPWRTIFESENCVFQSWPGWGVHGDMTPPLIGPPKRIVC